MENSVLGNALKGVPEEEEDDEEEEQEEGEGTEKKRKESSNVEEPESIDGKKY